MNQLLSTFFTNFWESWCSGRFTTRWAIQIWRIIYLFNSSVHSNLKTFSNLLSEKCHLKSFETGAKAEDIRNYFKSLMGPNKRILFEIITTNNYIFQLFKKLYKKMRSQCYGHSTGVFIKLWDQKKSTQFILLESNVKNLLTYFFQFTKRVK